MADAYWFCNRYIGHWWATLDRGVHRCRFCRCFQFDEGAATDEKLSVYLLGNAVSTTEPSTDADSQ